MARPLLGQDRTMGHRGTVLQVFDSPRLDRLLRGQKVRLRFSENGQGEKDKDKSEGLRLGSWTLCGLSSLANLVWPWVTQSPRVTGMEGRRRSRGRLLPAGPGEGVDKNEFGLL